MKSIYILLALILNVLLPVTAFAFDIGVADVHSELYQNLNADIPLSNTSDIAVKQLQVNPAPDHAYYLRGIAPDPVIKQLNFYIKPGSGNAVLVITSTAPVTEPILNLLVEFKYPRNETIKKITLLPQLPGEGDAAPLVMQRPVMIDFNQKINALETSTKKFWSETINKIMALIRTGAA